MPYFSTLSSVVTLTLAASSFALPSNIKARANPAPCAAFGPADEFYYKQSAHSSPLYGVQIDASSGVLTAVSTRDTNVQFQFEKCDAPSTGYIQGQPITKGLAADYFGHVREVSSGKCLRHRHDSKDFILDECPTTDDAASQLPFWFETPAENGVVRFTGYQNTTAYPQPEWFALPSGSAPFSIVTQLNGAGGSANQYVLARPIHV